MNQKWAELETTSTLHTLINTFRTKMYLCCHSKYISGIFFHNLHIFHLCSFTFCFLSSLFFNFSRLPLLYTFNATVSFPLFMPFQQFFPFPSQAFILYLHMDLLHFILTFLYLLSHDLCFLFCQSFLSLFSSLSLPCESSGFLCVVDATDHDLLFE